MSSRILMWALALAIAMLLAACGTYVPKGATVISVKGSKVEFERADLRAADTGFHNDQIIPMKWYDSNTFLTTATLAPGVYSFRARNYEGGGIVQNVTIEPDKHLYEITQQQRASPQPGAAVTGPEVKGRVAGVKGANVSILFIGRDIIMRTARLGNDGSFTVMAPGQGTWKIEVHMLGASPMSYYSPAITLAKNHDLGLIALK